MQNIHAPSERRSISTAVRHRRIGVALAEALVVVALVLSICAVLLAMGSGAGYAAQGACELLRIACV